MSFLAMGGYAAYVWPAYAASLVILGGLTASTIRRYRAARRLLATLETARREGRK